MAFRFIDFRLTNILFAKIELLISLNLGKHCKIIILYITITCEFHCFLIASFEQGKQNLWWFTDGHCTKWVSSMRSLQFVQRMILSTAAAAAACVVLFPWGGPEWWALRRSWPLWEYAETWPEVEWCWLWCSGELVEVGDMDVVVWASPVKRILEFYLIFITS